MASDAKVFKVMIASPRDVEAEKNIARDVIWQWNYLHSTHTKIVLMPVTWETHSAPAMGNRPQAIINKQVLEDCDLLIGIFWTRVGSPTGEEISGTVEEIKKHRDAGKPVMLYFSSIPVRQDSVDSKQYELLKQFKEYCQEQGLVKSYSDIAEFKEELYRDLVKTVFGNDYFKTIVNVPGAPAAETTVTGVEPDLTKEARNLLLEAVQDSKGSVLRVMTLGGLIVQANNKNMVTDKDPRIQATWEDAINELCDKGLIEDRGYKHEVFRVTHTGYELADLLIKQ